MPGSRASLPPPCVACNINPSEIDSIGGSPRDLEGPTVVYEQHKREDRNTEAQCTAEGFMLLPFIVEAHYGAFGADAKKLLRQMGQRFASSSGGNVGSKVSELAMRIQATLHRETARAVLRRWSHRLEGLPRAFQ